MTKTWAATVCALAIACVSQVTVAQENSYALVNGRLFNGIDNKIIENATVYVVDGKIDRIADSEDDIPSGFTVIDLEQNYLMPGLIDAHTHIQALDQAERALLSGATTVRTASVPAYQDIALRELVSNGNFAGPDVVAAGVYVTPKLGETVLADPRLSEVEGLVDTDDELRLLVAINADRGVDVIKTRATERAGLPDTDPRKQVYSERQLRVIVDAAASHGLSVMAHAHGDEGARAAVLAGVRSIEHGTYLSSETLRLMQERGTWFVPTYVTMDEMNEEQYDHVLRLRGKYMVPQLERAIREAIALGVKIATGADNYYDNKSINRISVEVAEFVRMGMSNFDALQAATVGTAELLQIADATGQITVGYEADMILVPTNPLTNIEALQDVLLVMSNGRLALQRIPFAVSEED
ncbi:MAG: amidohydrolase family protein [Woeseiaceae bacterium]